MATYIQSFAFNSLTINIYSRLSSNSEAFASELLDNLKEVYVLSGYTTSIEMNVLSLRFKTVEFLKRPLQN